MHERKAFTMVELLVTIAIIAILIGLILPALAAARHAARTTACASNLRQIGIAIENYSVDWGFMPASVNTDETDNAPVVLNGFEHVFEAFHPWQVLIHPYVDDEYQVTLDPAHLGQMLEFSGTHAAVPGGNEGHLWSNYGMNKRVTANVVANPNRKHKRREIFISPSETIMVADAGIYSITFDGSLDMTEVEGQYYVPGGPPVYFGDIHDVPWAPDDAMGRHPRKSINIVFGDLHVDRRRADRLHEKLQTGELAKTDRLFHPR